MEAYQDHSLFPISGGLSEVNVVSIYVGDTLFRGVDQRIISKFSFELYGVIPSVYNADSRLIWANAVCIQRENMQTVSDSSDEASSL